jgi:predicted transglutaminase-like cysteine proteinase
MLSVIRIRLLAALLIGAGFACATLAQVPGLGFTVSVSQNLIRTFSARFGTEAPVRIAEWKEFARVQQAAFAERGPRDSPDPASLASLNRFFNRVRFVSDLSHWSAEDYWSTPAELMASDGGDCEDFSVAKYFMLKELGVPIHKLRITYVTSRRINEPHMVLAYYPTPDADPLILDNLEQTVRRASQRSDLVPVYSFNDDELWLAQRGRVGSPVQIRMWRVLLQNLEREARI